jgi:predicted nucleic acid-binding protein
MRFISPARLIENCPNEFPPLDLMIASVAVVYDLTLVTHNTADFRNVPDLRLEDWLVR